MQAGSAAAAAPVPRGRALEQQLPLPLLARERRRGLEIGARSAAVQPSSRVKTCVDGRLRSVAVRPDASHALQDGRVRRPRRVRPATVEVDRGRRVVNRPLGHRHAALMASTGADGPVALSEAIREARAELDATIEEIRKLPGFKTFLAAPTFEDVAEAASDHPLVYTAPADPGGLALIVKGTRVEHVPLPGLTTELVADRVEAYLGAHDARRHDRRRWVAALDDVTEWLWEAAMGPVLEAARPAPEIVIVAGGLLGLLPLHAAWMPDARAVTGRRYALDLATIRYAPNARALTAARRLAEKTALSTALVIADPQPVRARALEWADVEGAAAAAAFPGRAIVRADREATEAEFRIVAPTRRRAAPRLSRCRAAGRSAGERTAAGGPQLADAPRADRDAAQRAARGAVRLRDIAARHRAARRGRRAADGPAAGRRRERHRVAMGSARLRDRAADGALLRWHPGDVAGGRAAGGATVDA